MGRHEGSEAEQQVTLNLRAEQATYTEARTRANRVDQTNAAITGTSSTEVLWRQLIGKMAAVFPAGVQATQWTTTGLSSLDSVTEPSGLFPVASVARVDVSGIANSLATISALLNNLKTLPGVVSVGLNNVTADESGLGTVITVKFDSSIYEGRFREGWVPTAAPTPAPVVPEPADGDATGDGSTGDSASSNGEDDQ